MQTSYGNHLWLAYANCEQLKAVRVSHDMNAYIATGMLVTPLTLLEEKTSAQEFTGHLRQQIQALDPVAFETLVNGAAQKNMSKDIEIKSGQPADLSRHSDRSDLHAASRIDRSKHRTVHHHRVRCRDVDQEIDRWWQFSLIRI